MAKKKVTSSASVVQKMMQTPNKAQVEKIVDTPIVPTRTAPKPKAQKRSTLETVMHFAREAGGIDQLRAQVETISTVLSANLKA